MLSNFKIPKFENYIKLDGHKHHLCGQFFYKNPAGPRQNSHSCRKFDAKTRLKIDKKLIKIIFYIHIEPQNTYANLIPICQFICQFVVNRGIFGGLI